MFNVIKTARYYGKHPIEQPSEIEEQELIEQAKDGCSDSLHTLVALYAPLILSIAPKMPTEDDASVLGLAFVEAVNLFDSSVAPRLGGILKSQLLNGRDAWQSDQQLVKVPPSTIKLYRRIMREGNGDAAYAATICRDFGMSTRRFWAAHDALTYGEYVAPGEWERLEVHDADSELVDIAVSVLEGKESVVVSRLYGFETVLVDGVEVYPEGSAPLPLNIVGRSMNLSPTRIHKIKNRSLTKMRHALVETFSDDVEVAA